MSLVPTFSVVMAACDRSRHILPSIQSILDQDRQDFELIVVGDCCTDDTADVVRPFLSPRVRWFNLPVRGGSQSFPNNAAIAQSRGRYIAYLGHDDVWARDHLSALACVFEQDPALDFAVSGTIYHGPRASDYRIVTGIFNEEQAALRHFFPPSSLAHRRDVSERIGPWADPREIAPPVDAEFQLRAAHSGMRFASTQRVTVHKFAAGHRYLNYLKQTSDEQLRMLRRLPSEGYDRYVMAEVTKAKAAGTFMIATHRDYGQFEKGELAELNGRNRGIVRPELRPLLQPQVIKQDNHPRALDWRHFDTDDAWIRWVDRNPRPKLLIPFSHAGQADIRLSIWAKQVKALESLAVSVDGSLEVARLSHIRRRGDLWKAKASVKALLKPDDYTILELHLNKLQRPSGPDRGLGVAKIEVIPLGWRYLAGRLRAKLAQLRPRRPTS